MATPLTDTNGNALTDTDGNALVFMDSFFWVGSGADQASDGSKWAATSGGVGGYGVPGDCDIAMYDANSGDCDFNIAQVGGYKQLAGYASVVTPSVATNLGFVCIDGGTLNGGTLSLVISECTRTGGVFTSTSGVLSLTSHWTRTGGVFNHNNGQVDMVQPSGTQLYDSNALEVFYTLRIAKGVWDTQVVDQNLQVSNRLIIDNAAFSSSPQLFGVIELIDNAILEQNGNMHSPVGSELLFNGVNHEWIQNNINTMAQAPAITVNCTDLTLTEGVAGNTFGTHKLTWLAGTITNSETAHFNDNEQFAHMTFALFQDLTIGAMSFNSLNFDVVVTDVAETGSRILTVNGDTTITDAASGTQFLLGELHAKGNYTQDGVGIGFGTGVLKFVGTGNQSINITGGAAGTMFADIIVDKPSGFLTLLSDVNQSGTGQSFTHTSGILDTNGFNLETAGPMSLNANLANMGGTTVTVGTDFSASNCDLKASTIDWFLIVAGDNSAMNCDIQHCNANFGQQLIAEASTDSGDNHSVLFVALIKYFRSIGGSASDNVAWSLTSGGPNDTTAPGPGDMAILDSSSGDCDWDVLELAALVTIAGYAGMFMMIFPSPQIMNCSLIDLAGGAIMHTGSGQSIVCDNFKQVTGSSFIKSLEADLTVTKNFENSSTTAGNDWQGLVTVGSSGVTSFIRVDDFKSRIDWQPVSGARYEATGRCYLDLWKEVFAGDYQFFSDGGGLRQIVAPEFEEILNVVWDNVNMDQLLIPITQTVMTGKTIDFGVCRLWVNEDSVITFPGNIKTKGFTEVWKDGTTVTLTVDGTFDVGELAVGSNSSLNRGGAVDGSGSMVCDKCVVYDNLHNGSVESILDLSNLSVFDCSGDFFIEQNATGIGSILGLEIAIGGDITFDAAAIIDFRDATDINSYGTATITMSVSGNGIRNLLCAAENEVTTNGSTSYVYGLLSFGGGTIDINSTTQHADGTGLQLQGSATWLDTGGSGVLRFNPDTGDIQISGGHSLVTSIQMWSSSGSFDFSLVGDFETSGGVTLRSTNAGNIATLNLDSYTLTCNNINTGSAGDALLTGIINVQTGRLISTSGACNVRGTDSELNTDSGEFSSVGNLAQTGGVINNTGIIQCDDYVPSVGVVFNSSGVIKVVGDFNGDNNVFTKSWALGTLMFIGLASQLYRLGGGTGPGLVHVRKTGSSVRIIEDQSSGTDIKFDASEGTALVELTTSVPLNFGKILWAGSPGNKTYVGSQTPPTKFNAIFQEAAIPAVFFTEWLNSNVDGIIQVVDTNTGGDGGNNDIAGAEGLDFQALDNPFNSLILDSGLSLGLRL